jgi:hypothetical protein
MPTRQKHHIIPIHLPIPPRIPRNLFIQQPLHRFPHRRQNQHKLTPMPACIRHIEHIRRTQLARIPCEQAMHRLMQQRTQAALMPCALRATRRRQAHETRIHNDASVCAIRAAQHISRRQINPTERRAVGPEEEQIAVQRQQALHFADTDCLRDAGPAGAHVAFGAELGQCGFLVRVHEVFGREDVLHCRARETEGVEFGRRRQGLRGDATTGFFHVMDEAFGLGCLVFCGADGVEIGRVLVAGAVVGSRLDSVDQGAHVAWFGGG